MRYQAVRKVSRERIFCRMQKRSEKSERTGMSAVPAGSGQAGSNILLVAGPPVLSGAAFILGAPWYVAAGLLLTAQYWYGPLFVYYRQRIPAYTALRLHRSADDCPMEHREFFDRTLPLLQHEGFEKLGRCSYEDERPRITGSIALLQNSATSDIAQVMIVTRAGHKESGQLVGFSRTRTDGSRILTGRSTIQSAIPPNPGDAVLTVDARVPVSDLWAVHCARTAYDPKAIRNAAVADVLGFQTDAEREAARWHVRSGLWQPDERPGVLRPTAHGAVYMCLRMLPPWKQISRLHGRLRFRRLLRDAGRTTGVT